VCTVLVVGFGAAFRGDEVLDDDPTTRCTDFEQAARPAAAAARNARLERAIKKRTATLRQ
jgi:hypothetical protein